MGGILSEDKVCFARSQFADHELAALSALAEQLGATVVSPPDTEAVLITQPLSSAYTAPAEPSAPYHWLGACASENARVDPNELEPPFFVTNLPAEDPRPLKFWVSVNVRRDRAEPADAAKATVVAKLRRHGGIVIEKRSPADILIVNKESAFYQTVVKEIEEHHRHWQVVAEKDWVDACVAERRLLGETDVDFGLKRHRSPSADSLDMDDGPRKKGPGRPPGRPRNEYTPNDDEFLCRFLAAYFPHGSHGSRKTYENLVTRQDTEPFLIAQHHTSQSWHERYKKNSGPFSRRILRFQEQGIGLDLLTPVERERAAETKRRMAELKTSKKKPSSPQQPSPRTSLVELGDDDDDVVASQPQPQKSALPLGRVGRTTVRSSPSKSFVRSPPIEAGPSRKSITPDASSRSTTPRPHPPQSSTRRGSGTRTETTPAPVAASAARRKEGAIASPFGSPTTRQGRFASSGSPSLQDAPDVPAQVIGRSSEKTPPIEPTKPVQQQPEGPAQSAQVASTNEHAAPAGRRSEGSQGAAPEATLGEDNGIARSDLTQPKPRSALNTPEPRKAQTPRTVARSRADVVEVVVSPLPRSPRPSTKSPHGASRPSRPSNSSATPRILVERGGTEHLTPAQKVEHGAQLVAAARETYRANIAAYSEKYGCSPTELFTIVNSLGKQGAGKGSGMYWEDVERGLKDRFGY